SSPATEAPDLSITHVGRSRSMSLPFASASPLVASLLLAGPAAAQQETDLSERPLRPLSRRELDRREAQSLYGLGAQHEQRNRLPEALRAYEKALRLDPDSAAIRRAL